MGPQGKRKRPLQEDSNLKRFKFAVNKFTKEQGDGIDENDDRFKSEKTKMTRKEMRKEKRSLKKMRKHAFKQGQTLPTHETLQKERDVKEKQEKKRKKQQDKRKRQRETKREKRREERQEEEEKKAAAEAANKKEDKLIKELEKQLYLKKRKSKNLPQGFINDGLDYLLDAIDPDKLKVWGENQDISTAGGLNLDLDSGDDDDEDSGAEDLSMIDEDEEREDWEDDDGEDDSENGEDDNGEDDSGENDSENGEDLSEGASDEEGGDSLDSEEDEKQIKGIIKDKSKEKKIMKKNVTFNDNLLEEATSSKTNSKKGSLDANDIKKQINKSKKNKTVSEDKNRKIINVDKHNPQEKTIAPSDSEVMEFNSDNENDDVESENEDEREEGSEDSGDDISDAEDEAELEEDDISDTDAIEDGYNDEKDSDTEDTKHPGLKEDIYGRLRDDQGNVVDSKSVSGSYVPPAKRLAMASTSDEKKKLELERMKKQLKGFLNRLSEANMQGISGQIEELYRRHSRAYLSESLTDIMLDPCMSPVAIPERLLMEQAMLLAVLHSNVGSEVGAVFLQFWAQKFQELLAKGEQYGTGKEMDNLVVFLAHCYNFKIVHSLLVFEILKKFSESFSKRDIELILVIFKNVGFSLRKDDPSSLKDTIVEIQSKASALDTSKCADKSRVDFMLEVLMAIRNNNMRKIPNYDPTHLEHLKKVLRNISKGVGSSDQQLRISLEDLMNAEEKGRWWLVGSAWAGRGATSQQQSVSKTSMPAFADNVSDKILELAKKQRMNTDIRKNIFCLIMTCEDFVDAFEKLLRLGLKPQQEREIVHVAIDMCMQEKSYNPFYTYLLQKLCEFHRRFQMTVQFSCWDKFKELSGMEAYKISNLGSLLIHLIATKAVSLSIFKVIEFSELDKSKLSLIRQVLGSLLLDYPDYTVKDIFSRIAPFPKLAVLREGLKLFIRHFLLRKKSKESDQYDLLKERAELAEKALSSADSSMML